MPPCRWTIPLPYAILGLLLAVWISLGAWICFAAPYGSGTDESIRYVAFVAAKNRWASQEDAAVFRIDSHYYPPLYYLLFAPFYGDEPSFTTAYPEVAAHPARFNGGRQLFPWYEPHQIPPELLRLYRTAKVVSLLFGLGVIGCLVATLRLLFPVPNRDWLVLGGAAPLVLLPQFLYYQTLVNNDCLVNFFCALATFLFVRSTCSAECRDVVASRRQGLFCAGAIGLGLLTKQSAVALTPLLPALAFLLARAEKPSGRGTTAGILRHLLGLTSVCFAAGGWWLLRSVLANDIGGLQTQRLAHPWAFEHSSFEWDFFSGVIGSISRNYIALFAGELFSIPDWIFLIYLFIAAALGTAFLGATIFRPSGNKPGSAPSTNRRVVWAMLAGTLAFNLVLIVIYNLEVIAPHGRLLFPSLVAIHALFALGLHTLAGSGRRLLVTLVLALTLCLGGLFHWTFRHRMTTAVTPPEEHLVLLGINPGAEINPLNPIWNWRLQQPLLLPPGQIIGLRFPLAYASFMPQLGTVISARLRTLGTGPEVQEHRFSPLSVGDTDAGGRWTEITLETPLDLRTDTSAMLLLEAEKPWFSFPGVNYGYPLIHLDSSPRLKPLIIDGQPSSFGMALTAVYR